MMGKTRMIALALSASLTFATPAALATSDDAVTIGHGNAKAAHSNSIYIVQMADPPAVAYDGGIAGMKPTRPRKGGKIDVQSREVIDYAAYLESKHDATLAAIGGAKKVYSYKYTFNGFAAELTKAQAKALEASPGVLSVGVDQKYTLATVSTPHFLGLDAARTGLWAQLGGQGNAGEDIVIGMVDSGIWPEHPSVSDRTGTIGNGGKLDYQQIPGWNAKCQNGEAFNNSMCNQKLIGAQYYLAGFGGAANIKAAFPYEYISARDADGHGTHTSTTAGGNANIVARIPNTSTMTPKRSKSRPNIIAVAPVTAIAPA